jgi:hypothetical protein
MSKSSAPKPASFALATFVVIAVRFGKDPAPTTAPGSAASLPRLTRWDSWRYSAPLIVLNSAFGVSSRVPARVQTYGY